MRSFLMLSEQETEILYYALSFLFESKFEFEDKEANQALERIFDRVINAYEDMNAPLDDEEQEYLERRF